MEGHNKLCMNCFTEHTYDWQGTRCPVCGWDNSKKQISDGLQYNTILNNRYIIGRAKSINGEGVTYAAFDQVHKKVVEIREFYPLSISARNEDNTIEATSSNEAHFDQYLVDFISLSRNISRVKEVTVVNSVQEIFEENYTAYTVYEYVPSVTLRRYIQNVGGSISWNKANSLFMPVLTAMGLMGSIGANHLGLSPKTLRVTQDGNLLVSGFCSEAARHVGTPIIEDLTPGYAAIEQYTPELDCGESTDVYSFAATLLFALTGSTPVESPRRLRDQRLMISKEVLKELPGYVVTAIANALQVKQVDRTSSFERFRVELTGAPTTFTELKVTEAIRTLPPADQQEAVVRRSRGLPPIVWLAGTCIITLVALLIVSFFWLRDADFTLNYSPFATESAVVEMIMVPDITNKNYEELAQEIKDGKHGFVLKSSANEFSDTITEGSIISQNPGKGVEISKGDAIVVTVSKGSQTRTLPEIKGMTFYEMSSILQDNGFKIVKEERSDENITTGNVIEYKDHKESDALEYGSTITVIVSSGAEEVSSSLPEPE